MSDAINFPQTPTQQPMHPMQQSLHQQQQQAPPMITPSHLDSSIENTPPLPQIRIASGHRSSKSSGTPLPQMRNPPEPYGVHEFQPKTPERHDAAGNKGATEGEMGGEVAYSRCVAEVNAHGFITIGL